MNEKHLAGKTVLFYGIPAYGHIHSNLYFIRCLANHGIRVIYYTTENFRKEIEAHGCEYRSYPLKQENIDLSDGSRILRLYHLILKYTWDMLPPLLAEAKEESPWGIIFDSLALWGRAVGDLLTVRTFSFYSIVAIKRMGDRTFWSYASGFSADFFHYLGELPEALRIRRRLRSTYKITKLGPLSVLMNKGSHNLMGYSRRFQPGGSRFGKDYTFLGSLSVYRTVTKTNDFLCPSGPLIYICLGTVFNQDRELLRQVIAQFGGRYRTDFHVILVWDLEKAGAGLENERQALISLKNFTVRPFVNQIEIMKQASVFITAGGMNSIHEALNLGVPCILCPQQGEQRINAQQFESLGFGKVLGSPDQLYHKAMEVISEKSLWDEKLRKDLTCIQIEDGLKLFSE